MISNPRTHKGAVLITAYVMFACVAALLSARPRRCCDWENASAHAIGRGRAR